MMKNVKFPVVDWSTFRSDHSWVGFTAGDRHSSPVGSISGNARYSAPPVIFALPPEALNKSDRHPEISPL